MFLTGHRSAWQSKDLGRHFQKNQRGESLLSGELLVEQGFVVDVPLPIHSHTHGSLSCAPQGWFASRKFKLVSSNLSSSLFVQTKHLYLGTSKHTGSKNLPRFQMK